MKTLANQTLLYDDECPLCKAYTSGFIATGMLDENGRKAYSELSDEEHSFVDAHRACNEIALIDNNNKTVTYGIDSLIKVVGNSFPTIEKIGNMKLVNWFLKKLYSFISYNRKVIIPGKTSTDATPCVPDFNYRYRLAYVIFAVLITTIALFQYSKAIWPYAPGNFWRELLLAIGQIGFQSLFLLKESSKIRLNYLGNLLTVSVLGSLLLLPIIVLFHCFNISGIIALFLFSIIVFIMFFEHYRRVNLLQLPKYLCLTWIVYRILALPFYYL